MPRDKAVNGMKAEQYETERETTREMAASCSLCKSAKDSNKRQSVE
jgi:hypothetical protein